MKEQTPLCAFKKGILQQPVFSRKGRCLSILFSLGLMAGNSLNAQTFTPIPVTGFTQDVVAESGSNSAALTSTVVDGSNYVFYNKTFATANSISWGFPDNGTVVSGTRTFQLQPYNANNALYLSANTAAPNTAVSGTLTFTTPGIFSKVSVLAGSTEGSVTVTATFIFTDGTTATTPAASILDWTTFGTPTSPMAIAISGIGRLSRAIAGPYSNINTGSSATYPRLLSWDALVPCASQGKIVSAITFKATNSSRAIIFAVSGTAYTPTVVGATTVIPAHCGGNNGIVSLAVSGVSSPYTYSWNTTPVQTGAVASNLAPGPYTCTVTDGSGCTYLYPTVITAIAPSTLTAAANPATVCSGSSTTLSVTPSSYTPATYTWTPGTQTGTSITVSPTTATTYTVSGTDYYGCTATATVSVAVNAAPAASFTIAPDTACVNTPQTVAFTGTAGTYSTYDWGGFGGATVKSGTGAGPYIIQFSQSGIYNVQLKVTDNNCSSTFTKSLKILGPAAAPVISIQSVTTTSISFSWLPVAGAVGYEVSVNGGPYTAPSSGTTGTTHTVTGLQPLTPVKLDVIALGPESCQNSPAATASGKTLGDAVFIPNSFSPNGDGKNDVFRLYSNLAASMEMRIFNQWGELVFQTSNLTDGWDGRHKGQMQPSGVYIYAVRIKLLDGTEIVRKGAVNLLH